MTSNPDFKVTPLFDADYRPTTKTVEMRHGYNDIPIEVHRYTCVILNDRE